MRKHCGRTVPARGHRRRRRRWRDRQCGCRAAGFVRPSRRGAHAPPRPVRTEAQIAANLMGPWHLARAAAQSMLAAGAGGRLVIVASRAAQDVARNQAAYQVTKAAVLRLTKVMAAELRASEITVNAVLPGTVDTEANRESMPNADRSSWVKADSIGAVIEWLLSDAAGIV